MTKDKRYNTAKNLISGGYIKTLREITDTIPKTRLAIDLGINPARFSGMLENVNRFALKDLFALAELIEVDEKMILELAYNQYVSEKKNRRKKE